MVYVNKFVAVLKSNGKILRENEGIVSLPFNSEYSLLLKNLESRRVCVNITIDGRDVLYGNRLVIDPNSEKELLGFLQGTQVKHSFKFIQKTSNIQEYRGDKIDDGIVRIEFSFEKPIKSHGVYRGRTTIHEKKIPNYHPPLLGGDHDNYFRQYSVPIYAQNISYDGNYHNQQEPLKDEGITVEGSRIDQSFNYTTIGKLEESKVIILRMKGITKSGSSVSKPMTIHTKLTCQTCGRKSKSNSKFCAECGTNLEI